MSASPCHWIPQLPWLSSCVAWRGCGRAILTALAGLGSAARWEHVASGRSCSFRRPDRRDPSHVYPATSGIRSLLAASGCMGLEVTRTAPNHITRGRGQFSLVWQVLGSNQRRLSRRFYRPLPLAAEPDHRSTAPGVPRTVPALGRKTEADKTTPSWSRIGDQIGSFDAGQLRLDLDRLTGDIALWPSPRKGVAYRPGNLSEVLTEHFRKAHPRGARHPAHLHCRRVKPARPRATRA